MESWNAKGVIWWRFLLNIFKCFIWLLCYQVNTECRYHLASVCFCLWGMAIRADAGKQFWVVPLVPQDPEEEYMLNGTDEAFANNLVSKTKQNNTELFQDCEGHYCVCLLFM